jgi:hypothetical protein
VLRADAGFRWLAVLVFADDGAGCKAPRSLLYTGFVPKAPAGSPSDLVDPTAIGKLGEQREGLGALERDGQPPKLWASSRGDN